MTKISSENKYKIARLLPSDEAQSHPGVPNLQNRTVFQVCQVGCHDTRNRTRHPDRAYRVASSFWSSVSSPSGVTKQSGRRIAPASHLNVYIYVYVFNCNKFTPHKIRVQNDVVPSTKRRILVPSIKRRILVQNTKRRILVRSKNDVFWFEAKTTYSGSKLKTTYSGSKQKRRILVRSKNDVFWF